MIKQILLKRRAVSAGFPVKSYPGDAGYDLYCTEDKIIWPWQSVDLDTGWNVKIPEDHWGLITGRSSTFKRRRLIVVEGVIDSGYTGKMSVLIWNPWIWPKKVREGERLAQLIIIPCPHTHIHEVMQMPPTERGSKNFGSSGA